MLSDFESRLRAFAAVIIRVGLNLQRGQRLLITEPYELQGVARSAEPIVEAVKTVAAEAGCPGIDVIWGDGDRLREYALNKDWRGFVALVDGNARRMQACLQSQDALLFLQGSQPGLLDGIAPAGVAELRRVAWEHFGPVAQQLVQGATNWTVAPAPSPGWADTVYADLPAARRPAALWESVFEAMRITGQSDPLTAWPAHLQELQQARDGLNASRLKTLRYQGAGTNLTVGLPPEHLWFTAQLTAKSGRPFVANLPTEEVFTLPHRDTAEGTVRVSRPVNYGGAVIEGIGLEFHHGRVISAAARRNDALLQQLLATDEGAARLGEVALVMHATSLARSGRLFHHPLLDENAGNHVALGEAYAFCLRSPNPAALNRSLIHVDLPLDARVILSKVEPS